MEVSSMLSDKSKDVNIIDSNSFILINNKMNLIAVIAMKFKVKESNPESDFFASVDSKQDKKGKEQLALFSLEITKDGENDVFNSYGFPYTSDVEDIEIDETIKEIVVNSTKNFENFIRGNLEPISGGLDEEFILRTRVELDEAKKSILKELDRIKSLNGTLDLSSILSKYQHRKHILIMGEKGGGKTYAVDKMAKDNNITTVEIKGHEGIESIDLLGYYLKDETGNLVWLDGTLSEAFRKAKDEKVILFFDELLRVPKRELNILVGALTPMSDNTFTLRTNRIVDVKDGIGSSELIKIPTGNLWVIGTTNVGAGYNVDEIDTALSDRFRLVHKTTTIEEVKSIAEAHSGAITKTRLDTIIELFEKINSTQELGEIEHKINTRHISECLDLTGDDDINVFKSYMIDLIPTLVSMDVSGKPNKSEVEILKKIIDRTLR